MNIGLRKNYSKGITLIALIITIIMLLILAGISIVMLTGENGVLNKATKAKENTKEAQIKESVELMAQDYNIGNYTGEDENIKEYFQNQASKGEISSIRDNKDNTYTINDEGFKIKIDENGNIIEISEKEQKPVTEEI